MSWVTLGDGGIVSPREFSKQNGQCLNQRRGWPFQNQRTRGWERGQRRLALFYDWNILIKTVRAVSPPSRVPHCVRTTYSVLQRLLLTRILNHSVNVCIRQRAVFTLGLQQHVFWSILLQSYSWMTLGEYLNQTEPQFPHRKLIVIMRANICWIQMVEALFKHDFI